MTPLDNRRWNTEFTIDQILQAPEKWNDDYFVEVDLKFPQCLHFRLPLAPKKLLLWLSSSAKTFGTKPKLVGTLSNKSRSFIEAKLKFLCETWFGCQKTHRVCKFKQGSWLCVYMQQKLPSPNQLNFILQKNMNKLMSNACSVKTMEKEEKATEYEVCAQPSTSRNVCSQSSS